MIIVGPVIAPKEQGLSQLLEPMLDPSGPTSIDTRVKASGFESVENIDMDKLGRGPPA